MIATRSADCEDLHTTTSGAGPAFMPWSIGSFGDGAATMHFSIGMRCALPQLPTMGSRMQWAPLQRREIRKPKFRFLVAGPVVIGVLWSGVLLADKLDDFKEAASRTGCDAIPYSSDRSDCRSAQDDKDSRCRAFSCSRDEAERQLEKYKEKKKNLDEARARKNESAIRDLERAVKEIEDDLKERKYEADKRVDRAEACISAREKVQRVFSYVRSKVKDERDDALKPYAEKLASHYETEGERHARPIEEVKNARDNCRWVRSMSW